MLKGNLRKDFDRFPWQNNTKQLNAWKSGMTGYPIVDAGMRELRETGWMHNRVRMVTASFLVKHLRIHWKEGEKYFRDCLLDFNEANNIAGWQWVAGCGADAAPYFRIFNPILQGERFDPKGDYVKKWIPELSNVPQKFIHKPWELQEDIKNFEPKLALDGGNDGLDVIRKVIYKSNEILKVKGMLALEIGNEQFKKVSIILKKNKFRIRFLIKDYRDNVRSIISVKES